MKRHPNESYLRSHKPEPFLEQGERGYYQQQLEQQFPLYELSKLDDHTLMEVYDTDHEDRQDIINGYFEEEMK